MRSASWADRGRIASPAVARSAPDADLLARCVAAGTGEEVRIEELRRLSGGASRETWSFDAVLPDGSRRGLVLRRDPSTQVGQNDRATEYELLVTAARDGVPVPRTVALLSDDDGLGAGFVMERIEGETIARRILRNDEFAGARDVMASQCGAIAARIHAIPTADLPKLPTFDAAAQIEQQRSLLDDFAEPHPAFELGLRWLDERKPASHRPLTLVHGDFRNGNFIVGPDGIRSILDWELAHLGDPIEDLGWLCVKSWRFGVNDRLVGGFGDLDDLVRAYAAAGGNEVDEDAIRFWVALGTVRWGIITVAQAFTHLSGMVRSVELATLGRRAAEMEWDLLQILDGGL
jgi:aminoglycoside phosphotransferase (APT) family kinase protein